MWVKSEYAGEVAVLSTWLCALLPWSVSFLDARSGSAVWLRFLPGRFLFIQGFGLPSRFDWAWQVPGFVATRGEALASYVWIGGTVLFLVPFALSVAYYLDEDRVESWELDRLPRQFDPVRALGALLVASGGLLVVASGLFLWHQAGLTAPIGAVLQVGLGGLLLTVERK